MNFLKAVMGKLGTGWFASAKTPLNESRWLMVDVETSGLNTKTDELLAIAAVGLKVDWQRKQLQIDIGDSFSAFVRPARTSTKENILLHGIGVEQQRQAGDLKEALHAFQDFCADSPLIGFHARFDQTMLARGFREHLGSVPPNPWADLEHLCVLTQPQLRAKSLEQWMSAFGVRCAVRHQAAADCYAQAELLQCIWPKLSAQCKSWSDVADLSRHFHELVKAGR